MSELPSSNLYQVIWQVRRLFQRLRSLSENLLSGTGINTSQRALLEFLHQHQPQTVPQIAREKSVSRQHIQSVANELLSLDLISLSRNPDHKRSRHLRLTTKGKSLYKSIRKKETELVQQMETIFWQEDLETTSATLRSIDAYLASGDWEHHLKS
ncbi:MAG: MarR family transcriptional regulator [Gammaproteobacteria bacterium]|nr:MarR family transcriptional regulator [Gammaproteobacteria bacterium]